MSNVKSCDIAIIGAGHAACEAALAGARMGFNTVLVTLRADKIAQMSCNPAIGGIAKGQVVREIDSLGGEMAKATDRAGLQFKVLNKGKGPAVWSPRAQCDRELYRRTMTETLQKTANLTVLEGEASEITEKKGRVYSLKTASGDKFITKAIVATTGTFLNGVMHRGDKLFSGGRLNEPPSSYLTQSLKNLGLEVGRLRTATPMRLDGKTIDYSKCRLALGDDPPMPFSRFTPKLTQKMLPCWLTYTTPGVHNAVRENIKRVPLYSRKFDSIGPRNCPSIEAKIIKFAHHDRHQIFIEPEGYNTDEVYVNGYFTGMPEDIQEAMVHNTPGLENARFTQYGYGIEYDYCPPIQLRPSLESKKIEGLYFAGQICGTTGYEEAAGQGLIAGINAGLKLRGEGPLILKRDEAYIGVMIDDLVTRGIDEPYRLYTSRAEYRLMLRWDNADLRLMDYGHKVGLINDSIYGKFCDYRGLVEESIESGACIEGNEEDLLPWTNGDIKSQFDIHKKYEGYIRKQKYDIDRFRTLEKWKIPKDFNYNVVKGVLAGSKKSLMRVKPNSIGQAARVPWVTPSDINVILIHLKKIKKGKIDRKTLTLSSTAEH